MKPLFNIGPFPAYSTAQPDFSEGALFERSSIAYVIDAEGWKLVKQTALASSQIEIDKLEGMPKLDSVIRLRADKIPIALLQRVTSFFKAVYKKQKSEAVGYLLYRPPSAADSAPEPRGAWDFYVPPQAANGASAKYGPPPRVAGWTVAGTIHSHGSMGAFHSGTDQHDEAHMDGIHVTVGKVDSNFPEYSVSIVVDGARAVYSDISMVFEGMDSTGFPDEWLDRVTEGLPHKWKGDKEAEATFQSYLDGELTSVQLEAALDALDRRSAQSNVKQLDTTYGKQEKETGSFSFLDRRRFKRSWK